MGGKGTTSGVFLLLLAGMGLLLEGAFGEEGLCYGSPEDYLLIANVLFFFIGKGGRRRGVGCDGGGGGGGWHDASCEAAAAYFID